LGICGLGICSYSSGTEVKGQALRDAPVVLEEKAVVNRPELEEWWAKALDEVRIARNFVVVPQAGCAKPLTAVV